MLSWMSNWMLNRTPNKTSRNAAPVRAIFVACLVACLVGVVLAFSLFGCQNDSKKSSPPASSSEPAPPSDDPVPDDPVPDDPAPVFVCPEDPAESSAESSQGKGSISKLIIDAIDKNILLWGQGTTLYWRFEDDFFSYADDPKTAEEAMRKHLAAAIEGWGDAAPVRLEERQENWDFQLIADDKCDCDADGCLVGGSFYPHEFYQYPSLRTLTIYTTHLFKFQEPTEEYIVHILAHELGHIFGLRHSFAFEKEKDRLAVIYGTNVPQTVMNYGKEAQLTQTDRDEIKRLYEAIWSKELTAIDEVPISLLVRGKNGFEVDRSSIPPEDYFDHSLLASQCVALKFDSEIKDFLTNTCEKSIEIIYCLSADPNIQCQTEYKSETMQPGAQYPVDLSAYSEIYFFACFPPGKPAPYEGGLSCLVAAEDE